MRERRLPACLTDPGLEPVCVDCRRPLEPGEPRVTVRNASNPWAPWWRCTDCEYLAQQRPFAHALLKGLRGRRP